VLTSSDMYGYTAEPTDNAEGNSSLDDCIKDNPLVKPGDNPRGVEGTDFGKDDGNVHVGSGAALAEKEADAEKALSAIETTLAGQCVKDGLKAAIEDDAPRGLRVGDVSTSALPSLDVTDDSVVTRLTVPMTALGDDASLYLDLTYLREGRTLGGLVTLQTGSPFPDAERIRLATLVGDRMRGKEMNFPDSDPSPTGYSTFSDPSGVSMEHPNSWTVEPSNSDDPVVLFIDPPGAGPFRRNVNILTQSGPAPVTLDEYTALSLEQFDDVAGSTIFESRATTLAGLPGYRVSYQADLGSGELRFLSVWTIQGGDAWLVTYSSEPDRYEDGLPEVERFLTTVELAS